MAEAEHSGRDHIEINAGELHRDVGDDPSSQHRMPMCCQAMRNELREGDEIVSSPPEENGASLTIRYRLPR